MMTKAFPNVSGIQERSTNHQKTEGNLMPGGQEGGERQTGKIDKPDL